MKESMAPVREVRMFVGGVLVGLCLPHLPAVVMLGHGAGERLEAMVAPGAGFAAAACLVGAAAWSLATHRSPAPARAGAWGRFVARVRGERGVREIGDLDDLAARFARVRPSVSARREPALPDLGEWLVDRVGVPALGQDRAARDAAIARALSAQLSRPWQGIEAEMLSPERAVLLAMFALHAVEARGEAGERGWDHARLRDAAGACARRALSRGTDRSPLLDFALDGCLADLRREMAPLADEARRALAPGAPARRWIEGASAGHAWAETAWMSALAAARALAPLPEAEFGWLLDIDRPLAMALNAVGRPSFLPESLGAACHWREERRAGVALAEPRVEAAVRAISRALSARSVRASQAARKPDTIAPAVPLAPHR